MTVIPISVILTIEGGNMTEARKRASKKYDAANTKTYSLKLNVNTDADIINMLSASENVQGYIKRLLKNELDRRTK